MKTVSGVAVALVGFAALVGCTKKAPPDAEAPSRVPGEADALPSSEIPPPLARLRTTSADIALGNLDVQIRSHEQMLQRDASDARAKRALVELLLARGEYASRIADYERAAALADELAAQAPADGDVHLARAATLGTFHRFTDQLGELDAAERNKASPAAIRSARATAYMAQGRFDDAKALGAWDDTSALDTMGLATAAVLAGERGQPAESDRLFESARSKYHDVSPFPVAWMDFQRGALLERQGDRARAKVYFAEAHDALPTFAHPAVHLAGLETPANAIVILEPLIGKTDDPQVDASYADALRRVGRTEDASAPLARARSRYDELERKHPLAFADHAAQFHLGLGHDPARALVLARQNAKNRATEPAIDLWLTTALVAGSSADACDAVTAGSALRYATSAFRVTLATTRAGCDAAP